MSTFETLVVFAALMAVIALVAIAIDWVGRPLRNRRFIPRIYRYDDEIPPDPLLEPAPAPAAIAVPVAVPVHQVAVAAPSPVAHPVAQAALPQAEPVGATPASAAGSAFVTAAAPTESSPRPRGIARTIPVASASAWHPGMALDARVGDRRPTVAIKAERFWKDAAAHLADQSHFDERSRALMAEGKPPRRRNPRTGDYEVMELVGLRAASHRSDVRMRWPDDSVDPWSAT